MKVICAQLINVGARPSSAFPSASQIATSPQPSFSLTLEPPALAHPQVRPRLIPRNLPILLQRLRDRVLGMPRALLDQLLRGRIRHVRLRHERRLLLDLGGYPPQRAALRIQALLNRLELRARRDGVSGGGRRLRDGGLRRVRRCQAIRRMVCARCGGGQAACGFCSAEGCGGFGRRRTGGLE